MPISTITTDDTQNIAFGALSQVTNLATKTGLALIRIDEGTASSLSRRFLFQYGTGSNEQWALRTIAISGSIYIGFDVLWNGGLNAGQWRGSTPLSVGTIYHFGFSYDRGSAANDAVLYLNGQAETVTETATPTGSVNAGTTTDFRINSAFPGNTNVMKTTMWQGLVYNRIFPPAEILNAYNSRKFIPSRSGLVFCPNMHGPAGTIKDGDTMAAGNTIRDLVSGAYGVPAGSPVFRDNRYLSLGGE